MFKINVCLLVALIVMGLTIHSLNQRVNKLADNQVQLLQVLGQLNKQVLKLKWKDEVMKPGHTLM